MDEIEYVPGPRQLAFEAAVEDWGTAREWPYGEDERGRAWALLRAEVDDPSDRVLTDMVDYVWERAVTWTTYCPGGPALSYWDSQLAPAMRALWGGE